jgi:hypothetical protein
MLPRLTRFAVRHDRLLQAVSPFPPRNKKPSYREKFTTVKMVAPLPGVSRFYC